MPVRTPIFVCLPSVCSLDAHLYMHVKKAMGGLGDRSGKPKQFCTKFTSHFLPICHVSRATCRFSCFSSSVVRSPTLALLFSSSDSFWVMKVEGLSPLLDDAMGCRTLINKQFKKANSQLLVYDCLLVLREMQIHSFSPLDRLIWALLVVLPR